MSDVLPIRPRTESTSRRRRGRASLAVVVGLASLLGACADDPQRTTQALRSDPRPGLDAPTPPGSEERPAPDRSPSTAPGSSSPVEPSDGDQELCRSMRDFVESGASGDAEAMVDALNEWRDLAPQDLHDDLDAVIGMVETLQGVDETDPGAIGEVLGTLTDPALTAAIEELGRFATERCSLELDTGIGDLPG
jgi:hypothetical protein